MGGGVFLLQGINSYWAFPPLNNKKGGALLGEADGA